MLFLFVFHSSLFSQNVGISATGATPNSKAILDIDASGMSPKAGLLIPRLTTAERNTLSGSGTVPESLLIYNTTTQCFEAWNQAQLGWVSWACINCQLPSAFIASSASSVTATSFTANWSASTGATGYYLDVSTNNSFSSYVGSYNNLNVSNVTTYSVTGLSGSTTYYYRVRAYNNCGTSPNSTTVTQATPAPPLSAGCDISQTESSYGTVVTSISGSSKTWITRNLGATAQGSSAQNNSNAAVGCYFQFNRSQAYGFENGSLVNPTWTIYSINENSDWTSGNDPCTIQLGGSWRIPTYTEWLNAKVNGGLNSYTNAYASVLKLHTSGYSANGGLLLTLYDEGLFWSSTQADALYGWYFLIYNGGAMMHVYLKATGFPVRCLK